MNRGLILFLGVFATFAAAWLGLVLAPDAQLGDLRPAAIPHKTMTRPQPYSSVELAGRAVYVADGCIYCHSQQLRGGPFIADLQRGWGNRRTVPRDYVFDNPILLGTMRTGPDLSNIGARQQSDDWYYRHFYNPQITSPGSIMPPFPFFFDVVPAGANASNAIKLDYPTVTLLADVSRDELTALAAAGFVPNRYDSTARALRGNYDESKLARLAAVPGVARVEPSVPAGFALVPEPATEALVAYLKSLDHTYPLTPEDEAGVR